MKKKEKKQLKKIMKLMRERDEKNANLTESVYANSLAPSGDDVKFQIAAEQESESIYIKISGFHNFDHCIDYAEYLVKYLPLMLHNSEVMH